MGNLEDVSGRIFDRARAKRATAVWRRKNVKENAAQLLRAVGQAWRSARKLRAAPESPNGRERWPGMREHNVGHLPRINHLSA